MLEPTTTRSRIQSLDILRGIVMVIMALDHVRDFFHKVTLDGAGSVATGPTDMATTNPVLFFTRWITHYCAPVFVFLAGTSIYLMSLKKTKQDLSIFLLKRGLWLVLAEIIIITFGWTFDPEYHIIILQVIWAIGISMIILGLLVWLPYKLLFVLAIVIVFGHNLLDYPSINEGLKGGMASDLVYFSRFSYYPFSADNGFIIVYAFLPWTGLMMLGYCFGKLYEPAVEGVKRRKFLVGMGLGLTLLFIILRISNNYGDPVPWEVQPRGSVYTFLSFLNVNKYPPSLDFICMTIGPAMIVLAFLENINNKLTRFFKVFGRVPMFYYILHFYVIHLLVVIVFFASNFPLSEIRTDSLFLFRPSRFGFPLWGVYLVWIAVILILYPLCKNYDHYKSKNKKWWTGYI